MCLSNNRYEEVSVAFSGTILLAAEVQMAGQVQHLCGYYNKVERKAADDSIVDWVKGPAATAAEKDFGPRRGQLLGSQPGAAQRSTRSRPGLLSAAAPQPVKVPGSTLVGNAMLIALPAQPGTVHGDNLIPVSSYPSLFLDYARSLVPPRPRMRGGLLGGGLPKGVEVVSDFDGGVYDVVIADSAAKIVEAIAAVAPAKRPQVNPDLYAQLDKLYPNWTFLLFCFSEATAAQAGSALVHYTPMDAYSDLLYLPGLDGHNGMIETGKVALDHTILLDSYKTRRDAMPGKRVTFTDAGVQAAMPFLPVEVIGKKIPAGTLVRQGDFLFNLEEVRAGSFRALRAYPPGWASVFGARPQEEMPFYIRNDD